MRLIALLLALAFAPAYAEPTYTDDMTWSVKNETGSITLGLKKCEEPAIVARILPEVRSDFRAGVAEIKQPVGLSTLVPLCYDAVDMTGGYVTILSGDETFELPITVFTLDLGT